MTVSFTISSPFSTRPAHLNPAFFDELVQWELVYELLEYFQEAERHAALEEIVAALDTAAHHTVLELLPEEVHLEYLDLSEKYHHDTAMIVWIEEHIPEIKTILRHKLAQTKQQLKNALLEVEEMEQELE